MKRESIEKKVVAGLMIWGGSVAIAAYSGFLQAIPRELGAALAVAGIIIPAVIYFRNAPLREFISGLGIKTLTVFHIWRIGAGALFLFYGANDLLPEIFVANAGYGDIAVGLLAAVVLLMPEWNSKYWVFHVVGMADFVVAVGTGLTLVLSGNALMNNLFQLPVVLIPLFGVGVSGAMHIFAFDILRKSKGTEISQAIA
ncbi:MAG: hypothetical protein HKN33_04295 [Pyrinomonadaceae bacterium]|nr:hypothetical protein [Pyrinomonadaceae bacterium]